MPGSPSVPVTEAPAGPFRVVESNGYPVLRVQRRFLRTTLVAVYRDHLAVCRRYFKAPGITEEMMVESAEASLVRQFRRREIIAFADVTLIQENVVRHSRSWRWRSDFTVTSASRTASFSVLTAQVESVRAVLASQVGNRYVARTSQRLLRIGVPGVIFGTVVAPIALLAVLMGEPIIALIIGFLAGSELWMGWDLLRPLANWKPVDQHVLPSDPESTILTSGRGARRPRPIRSQILGWSLKTAGLIYWLTIASGPIGALETGAANALQVLLAIFTLAYIPAAFLIFVGYRLCQQAPEFSRTGHDRDGEEPIVFLRPFADDSRLTLQPPGILAALCGIRSQGQSWFASSGSDTGSRSLLKARSRTIIRSLWRGCLQTVQWQRLKSPSPAILANLVRCWHLGAPANDW